MNKVYSIPFGADFIGEVHRLMAQDGALETATLVFPGKRPSLYFKQRLADLAKAPQHPPQFFSMETFVDFIARRTRPDYVDMESMDAVWLLHKCLMELPGHPFSQKGFGDFLSWGYYLLEFIDYLDTEMIDDERLLSLEKNAQLGYDVPENINELLMHVIPLRRTFHARLAEERLFSRGYKHLCAAETILADGLDGLERIWFAGLFALSHAEKIIVKALIDAGKAHLILEGDPKEWPILRELTSYLDATLQDVPCAVRKRGFIQNHASIDTHTEILQVYDIIKSASQGRTAIILPLPEALFPILGFVADRINVPYNISMGYPLARTSLHDLVRTILTAKTLEGQDGSYPIAEYLSVIRHPFIRNLDLGVDLRSILNDIEKLFIDDSSTGSLADRPFICLREIERALPQHASSDIPAQIHRLCFEAFDDAGTIASFAQRLGDLLEFILSHTEVHSFILSGEIFRRTLEALEDLRTMRCAGVALDNHHLENRRAVCDCISSYLASLSLPFETKPIENLEIIGVLESRNINFDTVAVLDVNEGVLPQAKKVNPLIPLGIYDILKIPSPEYTEEIYRYSFERLIGSAVNVHLIWVDSEERPRSRYIERVIWEQELASGSINTVDIDKAIRAIAIHQPDSLPSVKKTREVCDILSTKVFSPSSLDDYLFCPILFYYKDILAFQEKMRVQEDIEVSRRGSLIHDILFKTFTPYVGKTIGKDNLDDIRHTMQMALSEQFSNKEMSGDWYLFKKLTEYKLDSFLRKHLHGIDGVSTVKHLEERFESTFITDGPSIRLKGKVDRVDFDDLAHRYTIIDYKTGGGRRYSPSIWKKCSFETSGEIHKWVKSFQLPIYVHLFKERYGVPLENIEAKLILLGKNGEESLFAKMSPEEKGFAFAQAMKGVATLVTELSDPAKPFSPYDTDRCPECTYRGLCHV